MSEAHAYEHGAFRLFRAGDLELKPPEYIIRGMLEIGVTAQVFGDPGTYKSFAALDMAASIATGRPFHGREVDQGPVVYIAGEGQGGIRRRLKAWEIVTGEDLTEAPLFVSAGPTALNDPDMAADTAKAIQAAVEAYGAPRLIVLDTLARNIGGDEQSTVDTAMMFRRTDEMRRQWGCTILYVHHSGHGAKDRGRGSSNIPASVDVDIHATREPDGVMQLVSRKTKDSEPMAPMAFTLHQVDLGIVDEYGDTVTSAVLKPTEYVEPKKSGATGKQQKRFMEVLTRLQSEAENNVRESGRAPAEARVSLEWLEKELKGPARQCPEDRISAKYWQRTIDALLEKGLIAINGPHIEPVERSRSRSHVPVPKGTGEHWEHLGGNGRVPKREKGNGLGTMGTPEGNGSDSDKPDANRTENGLFRQFMEDNGVPIIDMKTGEPWPAEEHQETEDADPDPDATYGWLEDDSSPVGGRLVEYEIDQDDGPDLDPDFDPDGYPEDIY